MKLLKSLLSNLFIIIAGSCVVAYYIGLKEISTDTGLLIIGGIALIAFVRFVKVFIKAFWFITVTDFSNTNSSHKLQRGQVDENGNPWVTAEYAETINDTCGEFTTVEELQAALIENEEHVEKSDHPVIMAEFLRQRRLREEGVGETEILRGTMWKYEEQVNELKAQRAAEAAADEHDRQVERDAKRWVNTVAQEVRNNGSVRNALNSLK